MSWQDGHLLVSLCSYIFMVHFNALTLELFKFVSPFWFESFRDLLVLVLLNAFVVLLNNIIFFFELIKQVFEFWDL